MAPDESDRLGALSREPDCHWCSHAAHLLSCDWCLCDAGGLQLGIDTALI